MGTFDAVSSLKLTGTFKNVVAGALTVPEDPIAITNEQTWAAGTGDNQADEFFTANGSLAATPTNHDLTTGMTNGFGQSVTLTKLKELFIQNLSTTAGENITISGDFGGVLGGTSPTISLGPSGVWVIRHPLAGYTVGVGTETLTLDPGAATISYALWGIGVT